MGQRQFDAGGVFLYTLFIFLPIILASIHTALTKRKKEPSSVTEIFLIYYLVICVGISSLIAGILQLFFADKVAAYVGWPATPFLKEVGMANLCFAVLGFASIWIKRQWRDAAAISKGLFLWLAGAGHIVNAVQTGNLSIGNIGPTLWYDILVPIALVTLLIFRDRKHQT